MIHAPLPSVMPANKRPVRAGTLMSCCLRTLAVTEAPSEVGTILECKYEEPGNVEMIVAHDGAWQWNHMAPFTPTNRE